MALIELTKGMLTVVDKEDLSLLNKFKWSSRKGSESLYYAFSAEAGRMHRFLMNAKKGEIVDHINGNSLDNRKCNLRIVSHQINIYNGKTRKNNKSGRQGVSFCKKRNRWRAFINNKKIHITSYFKTETEAIKFRRQLEETYIEFKLQTQRGQNE